MPVQRGIDHIVLCVDDLGAARQHYQSFGFTTTPLARHPFGTANSLVQLQGNFIELLTVAQPEKIPPMTPGHFSFGAFNAGYLAERQGMSMLVFQSDDARRDQAEFAQQGLTTYAPFDFSRQAMLPDGSEVTVAFSLAFVTDARMPEAAFFVCQQHAPQYFWKPEYQRHPNGATAITEVVMVAEDPPALAGFFGKVQGPERVTRKDGQISVATSRGRITVLTAGDFAARFPKVIHPEAPATPHFAAYRLAVADLGRAKARLEEGGVAHRQDGKTLQISADHALGAVIEFAQGDAG